ncbi:MAG: GDP-mannose-dependent alpha-(1-2)-phosphatidylinositol mannosyltransferase [bacterium ADurb.Bin236]|nr:MAG: GDP-mannose-dependent alpha-(1-2)-phosphatidylinositol mannosyltransferase [bacterium ADurb.Bin236]
MNPSGESGLFPNRIAFIGNFLPRRCGIATFTTDLLRAVSEAAPGNNCFAVVMNDTPKGYRYPSEVRFEVNQKNINDYHLAADFLNMSQLDFVCLQHEYGIFGGNDGGYIVELLRNLRMPVVTTLHTVLREPTPGQKDVLEKIAEYSDRLVVMSRTAEKILGETYSVPPEKIVMIPHGIPDMPFVDPNYYKDQFGVEGKTVLLTFGLISPGKGVEYMIEALPRIVKERPDIVYILLGATHPHILREQGESYRHSLQRLAVDRGVDKHIIFHNRFVELEELCEFLGAADIYVTPYLGREQIVSGTLAYSLGVGKALVSTPYWYAEELLDEGRGRIVPFRDSDAIAEQVLDLLGNDIERHAMRKRAYTFCRGMIWKEVARKYMEVFAEVREERETRPRFGISLMTLEKTSPELPQIKLDHLFRMTDDTGMLQHAKYVVPDRVHGYCTDDNARALIASLMGMNLASDNGEVFDLACRYMSFLYQAFNEETERFRNFMSYDRRWAEDTGSEDSHARAVWGLGMTVGLSENKELTRVALGLFEKALPALLSMTSPRAWAFGLVGIHAYLRRFGGDSEVRRIREELASRLFTAYRENASEDWPWIENIVTYANAKIPHALLLSGQWLGRDEMVDAGLRSLEWLVKTQTCRDNGHFAPIGNRGWLTREGCVKARFDQQPIEAMNMIEASIEAWNMTGDGKWLDTAGMCFNWFLGRNDLNTPIYDYTTGGCRDGLTPDGANDNQGAESTLAWLLSLMFMHSLQQPVVQRGKQHSETPAADMSPDEKEEEVLCIA